MALRPEEIMGMLEGIEETRAGFGRGALAGQELMTREQYEDRKRGLEQIVRGEEREDVALLELIDPYYGEGYMVDDRPVTPAEQAEAIKERRIPPEWRRAPEVRKIKVAKPAKPIRPRKMTEGLRKSLGRIIGDLLSAKKFQTEEAIGTKREAMDYIMTVYGISPKTHPSEWKKYIQPIINVYTDKPIPKLKLRGRAGEKKIYIRDVLMPKLDKIRPQFERILKEEITPEVRTYKTEAEARAAGKKAGDVIKLEGVGEVRLD